LSQEIKSDSPIVKGCLEDTRTYLEYLLKKYTNTFEILFPFHEHMTDLTPLMKHLQY